jgi:hypothetical protein
LQASQVTVKPRACGVAQSLIQQGLPAAVAMQFEITDQAAIIFAHELYGAVADGYPLDAALAEARRAIRNDGNPTEWATPVLYSRAPDGPLFDLPEGAMPIPAPPAATPTPSTFRDQDQQHEQHSTAGDQQVAAAPPTPTRRAGPPHMPVPSRTTSKWSATQARALEPSSRWRLFGSKAASDSEAVHAVAFSPDGRLLAGGTGHGRVVPWAVESAPQG